MKLLLLIQVFVFVFVSVAVVLFCHCHDCNQIETDERNPKAAESIYCKWFDPKSNGRQKILDAQHAGRHFDEDGILLLEGMCCQDLLEVNNLPRPVVILLMMMMS